jgi:hypothetical protein
LSGAPKRVGMMGAGCVDGVDRVVSVADSVDGSEGMNRLHGTGICGMGLRFPDIE